PAIVNIPIMSSAAVPAESAIPPSNIFDDSALVFNPENALNDSSTTNDARSHPNSFDKASTPETSHDFFQNSSNTNSNSFFCSSTAPTNAADFLNQYRYSGSVSGPMTVDLPAPDRKPTILPPQTYSTSTGCVLNCRKCSALLWDNPGSYEVVNNNRTMSVAAQALLSEESRSNLLPMEGHNHINVVYDIPAPIPQSSSLKVALADSGLFLLT
ncbi:hypothetical protein BVRB_032870, partial [Beta vulgaris subsp. vulgaris]